MAQSNTLLAQGFEAVKMPKEMLTEFYVALEKSLGLANAVMYNISKKIGKSLASKHYEGTISLEKAMNDMINMALENGFAKKIDVIEIGDGRVVLRVQGALFGECMKGKGSAVDMALVGLMAGWLQGAIGRRVEGRELKCVAKGDPHCEFVLKVF